MSKNCWVCELLVCPSKVSLGGFSTCSKRFLGLLGDFGSFWVLLFGACLCVFFFFLSGFLKRIQEKLALIGFCFELVGKVRTLKDHVTRGGIEKNERQSSRNSHDSSGEQDGNNEPKVGFQSN